MRYYAGIGSRQTPQDVLDLMAHIGARLCDDGWTLRSGGAEGADTAFYFGVTELSLPGAWDDDRLRAEVYLPWPSFGDPARWENVKHYGSPAHWTEPIAAEVHPAWERLSQGARKLHSRNVHQIRGERTDSIVSSFVICWTPQASGSGGTGQAIRLAEAYGVPVFDLADPSARERLEAYVA